VGEVPDKPSKAKKIHFVSLGCARNLIDSEVMVGLTTQAGYALTDDPAKANVIVVNTCGFVDSAKAESIDTILEMADYKETGSLETLLMTGCLAQRYPEALQDELPEVDYFLGTGEFPRIAEVLQEKPKTRGFFRRPKFLYDSATPRVPSGHRHSAFLKIAEGCSTRCAFCIIPKLRGPLRSRPIENVMQEARRLVAGGVREINLIAQDSTDYGADLELKDALPKLLREMNALDGLRWIRVHYMYPDKVTPKLVKAFGELDKVVPYVDMPIQHAHDAVLARMHRSVDASRIKDVIARFRETVPGAALRTGVIVGFPGETEAEFESLLAFLKETRFDHLGVFTYSHEEGTPAAKLADDVPAAVKEERKRLVMEQQAKLSKARLKKLVGKTVQVMIDGPSPETEHLLVARMATQAPDVDGVVYVNDGEANPGDIVPVKITDAFEHDLVGGITDGERDPAPKRPEPSPSNVSCDDAHHHDLEHGGGIAPGGARRSRVGLIIS
jgi:ribosomal protein S12 methylthiotransferase